MPITSKISALFFKHHQSESKKVKRSKRPRLLAAPAAPLVRVQNGPPISHHVALDAPLPPPRPALTARFDAVPDDLPTVIAPPAGTPAAEEPDTIDMTSSGEVASPGWCSFLCCRPCE